MLSASTGSHGVRLVVEDDGPGIPAHMAEDVFDEFVQVGKPAERVASGFGLGLPIVRRLVAAMDGSIWYTDSGLGGAGFVVQLHAAA
jgi:two-component system, OmpR family, sensor kinase